MSPKRFPIISAAPEKSPFIAFLTADAIEEAFLEIFSPALFVEAIEFFHASLILDSTFPNVVNAFSFISFALERKSLNIPDQ